jgi:hypothetical protein
LAERVVAAVAPDEVEMFPAVADVYLANPNRVLSRDADRDESLGFGVGDVETLLTPVVVYVAAAVVERMSDAVGQGVVDSIKKLLTILLRKKPQQVDEAGYPDSGESVRSMQDQARAVWRVAFDKAREAGLDDTKARIIANATVVELLLGPERPPTGDGQADES